MTKEIFIKYNWKTFIFSINRFNSNLQIYLYNENNDLLDSFSILCNSDDVVYYKKKYTKSNDLLNDLNEKNILNIINNQCFYWNASKKTILWKVEEIPQF